MTIHEVIEKAKEGGYEIPSSRYATKHFNIKVIFLDPSFWQCLGKALGWSDYAVCRDCGKTQCESNFHQAGVKAEWLYHWHRFIDHLAEGGPVESFFETL
jgi:hypothetical protein